MVESTLTSGSDIHSGTLADGIKALQDGDGAGVI
jgi:hypothetical protein